MRMPGDRAQAEEITRPVLSESFYKGSKEAIVTKGSKCGPQGKRRSKLRVGSISPLSNLGLLSQTGGPEGFGAERGTCLNSVFSRTTLACCPKVMVETVKRYCSHFGKRQWWPVLVADDGGEK